MKPLIRILVLAAVLPAGIRAQEVGDPMARIATALASAEAAGVPLQLLRLKQAEGKAKGVPIDRLAEGLENRAAALIAARQAMPASDVHAIAAGADAVQQGIGPDLLAYIEATVPPRRRFVAVFALTRLMQGGHGPGEAMHEVEEALRRGPHALPALAARADQARAVGLQGASPAFDPGFPGPPPGIPGVGPTRAGRGAFPGGNPGGG